MILSQNFKKLLQLLLLIFIFINLIPPQGLSAKDSWWDERWEHAMQLSIPIDTHMAEAKYQPISEILPYTLDGPD